MDTVSCTSTCHQSTKWQTRWSHGDPCWTLAKFSLRLHDKEISKNFAGTKLFKCTLHFKLMHQGQLGPQPSQKRRVLFFVAHLYIQFILFQMSNKALFIQSFIHSMFNHSSSSNSSSLLPLLSVSCMYLSDVATSSLLLSALLLTLRRAISSSW